MKRSGADAAPDSGAGRDLRTAAVACAKPQDRELASPQPENDLAQDERTVRRWKRAGFGIYLAFTFAAVIVTFFSVLGVHCGWHAPPPSGPQIDPNANNPAELRTCHRDLDRLLRDLHKEAFTVQARALRFDTNPATECRNWSKQWQLRWRTVAWRCRFRELAGQGVSPAIDQMAAVHAALDELHLGYTGQVDRFVETYVQRLRKLSKELGEVRATIDRRSPHAAAPSPGGSQTR